MSTYREVVHMVLDRLKMASDDNYYTTDHIMFLVDKYRAMFLKKVYNNIAKELPEIYYQTLCIDLEVTDTVPNLPCDGKILRSKKPIPQMIPRGIQYIYTDGFFGVNFSMIPISRMRHIGHDRWRRNAIYCSLGPDRHLYLKSGNPQYLYIKNIKLKAVFESYKDAAALACEGEEEEPCDPLDGTVRMEEAYIPLLLDAIVESLSRSAYLPKDNTNNAADDLSNISRITQPKEAEEANEEVEQ